jgi:hypothetical protein
VTILIADHVEINVLKINSVTTEPVFVTLLLVHVMINATYYKVIMIIADYVEINVPAILIVLTDSVSKLYLQNQIKYVMIPRFYATTHA